MTGQKLANPMAHITAFLAAGALAAVLALLAAPLAAQAAPLTAGVSAQATVSAQAQSDMNTFGIDVSQWQGSINWTKVANKAKFAIVRCGWGSNLSSQDDTRWLANAQGCLGAGIPMGVYLYSHARTTTMAKSEASHVIRCMKEAGLSSSSLTLPVYLDMEAPDANGLKPAKYKKIFEAFKKKMNAAGYGNVGLYANCSWFDSNLSTIELDAELRWVAHYNKTLFTGYPNVAAKGCGIWQYSSSASVSGISGRVDGNYADDDLSFLKNNKDSSKPKLFRLYNPNSGEHFYTTDTAERNRLKGLGWKYEGSVCKTPKTSNTPVYRLYNKKTGAHLYTTDDNERAVLAAGSAWKYEGIAWYSDDAKGKPVYRLYNPSWYPHNHHYTSDKNERNVLAKKQGWTKEGVGWYGLA